MPGLSIGVGLVWARSQRGAGTPAPTPAPTPTPSPTPSFSISQTSTRGSKPLSWQVDDPSGLVIGGYWNAQRAVGASEAQARANLAAGVTQAEAVQQITANDVYGGDVTLADLGATPSGPVALRLRWGQQDGEGAINFGAWSNAISDTIA